MSAPVAAVVQAESVGPTGPEVPHDVKFTPTGAAVPVGHAAAFAAGAVPKNPAITRFAGTSEITRARTTVRATPARSRAGEKRVSN